MGDISIRHLYNQEKVSGIEIESFYGINFHNILFIDHFHL